MTHKAFQDGGLAHRLGTHDCNHRQGEIRVQSCFPAIRFEADAGTVFQRKKKRETSRFKKHGNEHTKTRAKTHIFKFIRHRKEKASKIYENN